MQQKYLLWSYKHAQNTSYLFKFTQVKCGVGKVINLQPVYYMKLRCRGRKAIQIQISLYSQRCGRVENMRQQS